MNNIPVTVIVLAAGEGKRMKSSLPKVLHKISGYEMLYYSIKEAKKISDLLSEFQSNKIHKAIVVDEYGGSEGIITLEDILDNYLPKNQEINFLTIDVEGLDFDVLKSNNFEKYKPKMILIEIKLKQLSTWFYELTKLDLQSCKK